MADEHDVVAALVVKLRFLVDLGDERAGRIEEEHVARRGIRRHRLRHAVGGEDDRPVAFRDLVELFHEDGALGTKAFHHEFVVHDLVPHVDGRAVFLQRQFHDLDRPVDACAEAARSAQQNRQFRLGSGLIDH